MSKIISLHSENVKRLQVVEIAPNGNVVVIGGRNGQGKSSVLDSIQYALGGETSDRMPVRRGEQKAKVVLDLGDIIVRRTFTAEGGSALVVTNADGVKQASPQAILDKLVGRLTFDPLEFSRQKPKEQAETLRIMVGLDFEQHDADRAKVFAERTAVNREAETLKAQIVGIAKHEGVPEKEESTADVLKDQQAAQGRNQANADLRKAAKDAARSVSGHAEEVAEAKKAIKEIEDEIAQLQKNLADEKLVLSSAENAMATADTEKVKAETAAKDLKDEDMAGFTARLQTIEQTNQKVRSNQKRAELVRQFKAKTEAAEELTTKLEKADAAKRKATTEAKYPVDGLLFDTAGGVTLGGIPFEQCSSAEQLRVSVAIGLALNPKLKVLLVRDGSLLDPDSLKMLCDMAAAADAQVWIERVGTDAQTSVVIEDGQIKASVEEGALL